MGKVSSWFEFFATASPRQVYILRSLIDPDRHYVGLTADVHQRLAWHNVGQSAAHAEGGADTFPNDPAGSRFDGRGSQLSDGRRARGYGHGTASVAVVDRRLHLTGGSLSTPGERCGITSRRSVSSPSHSFGEQHFSPVRSQVSTELALRIEERERTRRSRGMPVAAALDLSSEAWASIRQRPLPS